MTTTSPDLPSLTCPKCQEPIDVTDAFRQAISRVAVSEDRIRTDAELARATKAAEQHGRAKAAVEMTGRMQATSHEMRDLRTANKQLVNELTAMVKELGRMKSQHEGLELEKEKELQSSREAIRLEERRRVEEQSQTHIIVLEKQLKDAEASAADMQRQLAQRSQQVQGDAFQSHLDGTLRQAFPTDEFQIVKRGQRGADIKQIVRTRTGEPCGMILWEAKNAHWQGAWIPKLRTDMRAAGADHAVLVSVNTPDSVGVVDQLEGTVWVSRPLAAVGLARLLRHSLLRAKEVLRVALDHDENIRRLQVYITGPEFQHRIEALKEFFEEGHREQDREHQFFSQKWARQSKRRQIVLENVLGLQGDFEGLTPPVRLAIDSATSEELAS